MALQAPVITLSGHVTETQKSLYSITFRMVCADSDPDMSGIDATYSGRYRPGDDLEDMRDDAVEFFQAQIDSYLAAAAIESHPKMALLITAIQNGLVI